MRIGEKVRFIRKEKNMSQEEMADALYVSAQAVSNWERSKSYPELNNIIRISELYDISLDELILEDVNYKEKLNEKQLDKKIDMSFDVAFTMALIIFSIYLILKHNYNGYLLVSIVYIAYNVTNLYKLFQKNKMKKP